MPNNLPEQRDQAYATASPAQRYLYSHGNSGEKLITIAKRHGVSDTQYKQFALAVGDVILGFYKITDLPILLRLQAGLSEEVANTITRDLIDFLTPLNDPSWLPPSDNEEEINDFAAEVSELEHMLYNKVVVANQEIQNEPLIQERASLEEPTYTSTQAAILGETRTPAPIPAPPRSANPLQPRWDTD